MKKTIGLGLLLLTGMTAFAAPAAAYERIIGRTEVVKQVVVVHHKNRWRNRRTVRVQYDRNRR